MDKTYTRQAILDAIALRPCHVTGLHDPIHTTRYVCELQTMESQTAESFKRLLEFLEVSVDNLPRKLHENCYWCHRGTDTKGLREWVNNAIQS